MYKEDKSDTSAELKSDVSDAMSTLKGTMGSSECSSQEEVDSSRGKLPVLGKASKFIMLLGPQ